MIQTQQEDNNLTPTDFVSNNSVDKEYEFLVSNTFDCDYEPEYIEEVRDLIRWGWNNPRKVLIPQKNAIKRIDIRIRNRLSNRSPPKLI
jgi:hypothetical protein